MFAKVVDMSKSPILEIRRGSPWGCCGYPAVPKTKKADVAEHPEVFRPRRLTHQRASRHSRVALHLVIRPLQINLSRSRVQIHHGFRPARIIGPRNGQSKWMSGFACVISVIE